MSNSYREAGTSCKRLYYKGVVPFVLDHLLHAFVQPFVYTPVTVQLYTWRTKYTEVLTRLFLINTVYV